MKIRDVVEKLELEVITGNDKLDKELNGAYVSDLLSDVMGRAKPGELWITMQTHNNIIAVACLKELPAILIINGGRPDESSIMAARKEGIVLLGTGEASFTISGKLYRLMEGDALV